MTPIAEQAALRGIEPPVGKTAVELRNEDFEIPASVRDWMVFSNADPLCIHVDVHCFGKETGYVWDTPRDPAVLEEIGLYIGMSFAELDCLGWPLEPTTPRFFHIEAWRLNAPPGKTPFVAGLYRTSLVPPAILDEISRLRALTGAKLEFTIKALRHWETYPHPAQTPWDRVSGLWASLVSTVLEGGPAKDYQDFELACAVADRMVTETFIEVPLEATSDFEAGWR